MKLGDAARLPARAWSKLRVQAHAGRLRARAAFVPTYPAALAEPLAGRFAFLDRGCLDRIQQHSPGHADLVRRRAEDALAHRFDLLGSGPVVVAHGIECRGVEGHRFPAGPRVAADAAGEWLAGRVNAPNLGEARRIWRLVGHGYQPIDWQLDFKSGYRWSERDWHRDVRFGAGDGADIKVPWELARLQHLPLLAMAACYAAAACPGFRPAEDYAGEVRRQVLDFVSTNPPGFGVNWVCAMDVAIRIANMLVARDMLASAGQAFDPAAEAVFCAGVRAHARHVAANLEWAPRFRGNHYLANLAGLVSCAAYLPADDESDLWLHFAASELRREIDYQFHPDGSNFEGSVSYHRLSGELVLWPLAALERLAPERLARLDATRTWTSAARPRLRLAPLPLHDVAGTGRRSLVPPWCRERVAGMARFTRGLTRPDGLVVQFGDNDSGRLFTFAGSEQLRASGDPAHPAWSLDQRGFVAAAGVFLGDAPSDVDGELLAGFAGPRPAGAAPAGSAPGVIGDEGVWRALQALAAACEPGSRHESVFPATRGLADEVQLEAFPGMGCFVFRGSRLYLAVRCGEIGVAGLGPHAHCDQLGIELVIDGQDRVRDPGTYLYTAVPQLRNAYRSAAAHHVPRSGAREPADLSRGAFDLRGMAEGECLYAGRFGFVGRHSGYGEWIYRSIAIEDDRVVVLDFSPQGLPVTDPAPAALPFSPGYGHVEGGAAR